MASHDTERVGLGEERGEAVGVRDCGRDGNGAEDRGFVRGRALGSSHGDERSGEEGGSAHFGCVVD